MKEMPSFDLEEFSGEIQEPAEVGKKHIKWLASVRINLEMMGLAIGVGMTTVNIARAFGVEVPHELLYAIAPVGTIISGLRIRKAYKKFDEDHGDEK